MAKYMMPAYRLIVGLSQMSEENARATIAEILRNAADDVERNGLPVRPNEYRRHWHAKCAGVSVVTNRSKLQDIWPRPK